MTKKHESHAGTALLLAGLTAAGAVAGYFLYGPQGAANRKKVTSWALKAKAEVLEQLEKAKEVSEERYHEIVDTVTKRYEGKRGVELDDLEKLNAELKRYWKQVKKEFTAAPKKKAPAKKRSATKKTTTPRATQPKA
jgi:hypothetical protein